jgi:coenzyme F420-reducing hydrogenase delta subunit/Fe-S-cluster-containing hydrogenase component 2
MCTGRVDLTHVLRAFSNGCDGVFIGGCHLGECNYITNGNYHAQNMVALAKKLLEHIGMNPERLRLNFMSGAEANLYADSVNAFVKTIKEIGPLGEMEGIVKEDLDARLAELTRMVPYIKVITNAKLGTPVYSHEEVENLFTTEEVDKLFTKEISYYIDPEKCQACMTCARRCPVGAIISAKQEVHIIDQDKCIRCGSCFEACPPKFRAITKLVGEPAPPPLPEGQRAIVKKDKEATA